MRFSGTEMPVAGATLVCMYCPNCDWLFTPTGKGLIPDHVGRTFKVVGTGQKDCGMSGKPSSRGLRSPREGDSRAMLCRGCDTRQRRGRRDGQINCHNRPDGTHCRWGRAQR